MLLSKLYKPEGNCMLRQSVISALAPEIIVSCQILVLGSMPGAISQKEAEYYAHPRNLFWDCVETAFQIDRNAPYHSRLATLVDAHIGLWDVLASCSRKASSDATIRDAKCNDFVKLLSAYPQINRICLNGRTAFDYWRRLVIPSFTNEIDKELLADVEIISLPSTSPAHAALSPAAKIDAWCKALSKR
jgi:double-stranded uracil-DNA glycosylase